MLTVAAYSLGAVAAAVVVAGAIWIIAASWGAARALGAMSDLRTRLTELETAFAGFAEQFELSYIRGAAKLGKLRRQLARERGEDEPDTDAPEDGRPDPVDRGPQGPAFASGADIVRLARARGMIR